MSTIHPITIRDLMIPSNVFFAPINPGWCNNGAFTKNYVDFFANHSGHEIGICYVGNVSLQNEWRSNCNTAVLSSNSAKDWKNLSNQIINHGSLPGIQLAWKPQQITLQKSFIIDDKESQIEYFKQFYNNFKDFDGVTNLYVKSIRDAIFLGFSVIQIHAAHGYALSILLSRSISECKDPVKTKGFKLIKKILSNLNNTSAILDIRLSLYEGIRDDPQEVEYKTKLVEHLIDLGFDMISFSNGFYNIDKTMIYPLKSKQPVNLDIITDLAKKHNNVFWNVCGNMENILMSEIEVPNNLTFSLGRQLLADPQIITKIKQKNLKNIIPCSECNSCHYYSYGFEGIQKCKL